VHEEGYVTRVLGCALTEKEGRAIGFRDKGEGFCVFNDIAVAATNAMRKFPERFAGAEHPILVIDLDVHQGNGTAKIFEDDPRVITFSAHGTYPILMGFVYAQLD
jgi:acetoin utilization deacetylase AcuC-like enzyme